MMGIVRRSCRETGIRLLHFPLPAPSSLYTRGPTFISQSAAGGSVHPAPHGALATDGARSMSRSFMACGDETGSATVARLFSCCDSVCEEVWETGRETLFHSGARHRGVLLGAGVGRNAACRTMARTEPPRATLDVRASVLLDALRWSDAPEPARGSRARGLVEGERESSRLAERFRLPVHATPRRPGPTVARSAPQPPRPASGPRSSPLHDSVVRGGGSRGPARQGGPVPAGAARVG